MTSPHDRRDRREAFGAQNTPEAAWRDQRLYSDVERSWSGSAARRAGDQGAARPGPVSPARFGSADAYIPIQHNYHPRDQEGHRGHVEDMRDAAQRQRRISEQRTRQQYPPRAYLPPEVQRQRGYVSPPQQMSYAPQPRGRKMGPVAGAAVGGAIGGVAVGGASVAAQEASTSDDCCDCTDECCDCDTCDGCCDCDAGLLEHCGDC